ncbi:MAG: hypothetical protein AB8B67_00775 [Rickettsiaceae bacterium]
MWDFIIEVIDSLKCCSGVDDNQFTFIHEYKDGSNKAFLDLEKDPKINYSIMSSIDELKVVIMENKALYQAKILDKTFGKYDNCFKSDKINQSFSTDTRYDLGMITPCMKSCEITQGYEMAGDILKELSSCSDSNVEA